MSDRSNTSKTVFNPLTDPDSEFHVTGGDYLAQMRNGVSNEKRLNPLYPRAKYIFVHKTSESPSSFRLKGTLRRTRNYAIAVLTDENRYYYNEFRTKQTVISQVSAGSMVRLFLDGYVINSDTRIMLDDTIKREGEPISIFLYIAAKTVGLKVIRRSLSDIMKSLDRMLKLNVKTKDGNIGTAQRQYIEKRMRNEGWLDFLPPNLAAELTSPSVGRMRKKKVFFAAAGIMYLFRRDRAKFRRDEKLRRKLRERTTASSADPSV